nr:thioredoxin [Moritella viscosa]
MMNKIVELRDDNFEAELMTGSQPVLVEYWASWCAPCLRVGPVLKEIAFAYSGKVKIGKLNIDTSPQIAAKYGIRALPAMMLFKDGEVLSSTVGVLSKTQLTTLLSQHI